MTYSHQSIISIEFRLILVSIIIDAIIIVTNVITK